MKELCIGLSLALLAVNTTPKIPDSDTYISETAVEACIEYGEEYNICPELLEAIIERESAGDPKAKNKDCIGLMQVSEKWNKKRMESLGCDDLYDERQNIQVGADYLAELFEKYEDVYLVLMCYNSGEYKAIKRYEKGLFSRYAVEICERSAELERLHGK